MELARSEAVSDDTVGVLHLNLAGGYRPGWLGLPVIRVVSPFINPLLAVYFGGARRGGYGCVLMDFAGAKLTERIYNTNFTVRKAAIPFQNALPPSGADPLDKADGWQTGPLSGLPLRDHPGRRFGTGILPDFGTTPERVVFSRRHSGILPEMNSYQPNISAQQQRGSLLYLGFCCFAWTFCGLLFGCDLIVIAGTKNWIDPHFQLSTLMEGWFVSSAMVGAMIGCLAAGSASERYGRKRALMVAAVFLLAGYLSCGLACSTPSLIFFRWIGGVGAGVASMVCPLYISEFFPARLRGRMVTLFQLAICVGIVAAMVINPGLLAWHHKLKGAEISGLLGMFNGMDMCRGRTGMVVIAAALTVLTLVAVWTADAVWNQLFPLTRDHVGKHVTFHVFAAVLIPQLFFVCKMGPETKRDILEEIKRSWQGGSQSSQSAAGLTGMPKVKVA